MGLCTALCYVPDPDHLRLELEGNLNFGYIFECVNNHVEQMR